MIFSGASEYALRALTHLALRRDREFVPVLRDHDRAIGSAIRLVELAGKETFDDGDVARVARLIRGVLPHVSDCDGLSIMVEKFPDETLARTAGGLSADAGRGIAGGGAGFSRHRPRRRRRSTPSPRDVHGVRGRGDQPARSSKGRGDRVPRVRRRGVLSATGLSAAFRGNGRFPGGSVSGFLVSPPLPSARPPRPGLVPMVSPRPTLR